MSPKEAEVGHKEFTRGEKCIFAHLVVSFVLILVIVLVYFCHLCVVRHGAGEAFRFTRRSAGDGTEEASQHTGAVVLRLAGDESVAERMVCGCVALRARWSAAPALCAAARTDPGLAAHLPSWAVRYRSDKRSVQEAGIARSVVHSHFNRDNAHNNIGLFEHTRALHVADYRFNERSVDDRFLYEQAPRLAVAAWGAGAPGNSEEPVVLWYPALPVVWEKCRQLMTPVTELRSYEMCAMIDVKNSAVLPPPGSALVAGSDVLGFFSWGDKHGSLPLVILKLANYKEWIERIVNE